MRPGAARRQAQAGVVTVLLALLLVAALIFALGQALSSAGSNARDSQRESDSTAALFLAESGLEKAQAAMASANILTSGVCTGVTSTYSLGRGTVTLAATSTPASCDSSGGTPCTGCQLTSTGTVGSTARSLSYGLSLNTLSGATCNASTSDCDNTPAVVWKLNLRNPYSVAAVALFNLSALHQGQSSGAVCSAGSACALAWDNSMNGQNSIESMGNVVTIAANGSYAIYQTNVVENLAQVGVLFRGSSVAPTVTGRRVVGGVTLNGAAYWSGNTQSKQPAGSTGTTNDGTATDSATQTCSDPATASSQSCTSWCYGGDTLVLGLASGASNISEDITAVSFNSSGGNNIPMTSLLNVDSQHKYPSTNSPNAPTNVYSSIWYARNSDYTSNADVYSGARVTGWVGANSFTGNINKNSTSLVVTNFSGTALAVGNVLQGDIDTGTVICAIAAGGGNGTYTVSASGTCGSPMKQGANHNTSQYIGVAGTTLTVTAVTTSGLATGDTLFVSGTSIGNITSGGGSTFVLNTSQFRAPGTSFQSNGKNVASASGTVIPVAGTVVAIKAGTGAFATGSTTFVTGPGTTPSGSAPTATAYTLSQSPTTPLQNATLCGGTCAYFNKSGTTTFSLTRSLGGGIQTSWSAGLMCLKGVNVTPEIVQSNKIQSGSWVETVN